MPTVDLFVYGTLRANYNRWDEGSVIDALAPNHYRRSDPGDWLLHDHALWCVKPDGRIGIPAVGECEGRTVVGDVVSVGAADFNELCRYEGFPSLYQLHGVEVQNAVTGTYVQTFIFMPEPEALSAFGSILPSGDYITPWPTSRLSGI